MLLKMETRCVCFLLTLLALIICECSILAIHVAMGIINEFIPKYLYANR